MITGEIFKRMVDYGFDEINVRKRFGNNIELYEACFLEFLAEQNYELLQNAMNEKNYAAAFEAAHALKGAAGNMGLLALYNAICILVESLRDNQFESVWNEYIAVKTEYEHLCNEVMPEYIAQKNTTKKAEATL